MPTMRPARRRGNVVGDALKHRTSNVVGNASMRYNIIHR